MTKPPPISGDLAGYEYYRSTPLTLYLGDAHTVLAAMPDNHVDCVVTSPPFWSLRDYGTGAWTGGDPHCEHLPPPRAANAACPRCAAVWSDPQYGLEPTVEQYLDRLVDVFDQLRRILTPAGTCWLNLGDCYTGGPKRAYDTHGGITAGRRQPATRNGSLLPPKNLVGLPWRAAFALQASGWWLRNAIIWAKPNHLSPFCLCCYWFLWPGDRRAERACGEVDGGAVDGLPVPAGSAALVPLASNTVSMANAAVTCVPTAQVR